MVNNDDKKNNNINDQIALYILTERLNELRELHRQKESRDLELFQQLSENQKILSERLLVVETNKEHVSEAIITLKKETSLQTKLLSGILLAAISAIVGVIVKAIVGA